MLMFNSFLHPGITSWGLRYEENSQFFTIMDNGYLFYSGNQKLFQIILSTVRGLNSKRIDL